MIIKLLPAYLLECSSTGWERLSRMSFGSHSTQPEVDTRDEWMDIDADGCWTWTWKEFHGRHHQGLGYIMVLGFHQGLGLLQGLRVSLYTMGIASASMNPITHSSQAFLLLL